MMQIAIRRPLCQHDKKVIIGDRKDTYITVGIESEIYTFLVLSDITSTGEIGQFAYRLHFVLNGITDIINY